MPRYSQISQLKLATCHKDLQTIFNEVIKTVDISIVCGHRNRKDQEIAFKNKASKLQWPNSKHNTYPSVAVDVAPYPIDWTNNNRFYWMAGFIMATAVHLYKTGKTNHLLRYGGDWNRNYHIDDEYGLSDLGHFELVGG